MVPEIDPSSPSDELTTARPGRDALAGNALGEALVLAELGYVLTPVTIHRNADGSKRAQFHARWSSATYHDRRSGQEVPGHSCDPAVVKDWSVQFSCSFGILCGPTGIEVVDLDEKHHAARWWELADLPVSANRVLSPAGEHLYWRRNGGPALVNNAGQVAPGVDARSVGGIVFAPGSFVLGPDGEPEPATYRARVPLPAPGELEPTPAQVVELWSRSGVHSSLPSVPDGLDAVATSANGANPVDPEPDIESAGERRFTLAQAREFIRTKVGEVLDQARPGNRNDSLNKAGMALGHFIDAFWTYDEAVTRLRVRGRALGLEPGEVEATIRSSLAAGMQSWLAVRAPESDPDVLSTEPAPEPGTDAFAAAVAASLGALRVREAARRAFATEQAPPDPGPGSTSIAALLGEPDEDPDWRVRDLWPTRGKVLMSAPQKAGKTTLIGNLVRCLADGTPFLDTPNRPDGSWIVQTSGFAVTGLDGRQVFVLDFEMTRKTFRRWYRDLRLANPDAVHVELMRGRRWDPRDDAVRARWAQYLRELDVAVLVVDPIGPVLQALGVEENSATEVGQVLTALDMLVREANVPETFVVHHTGHEGERARGASNFLGWPDALWYLTRDGVGGARALRAEGRDVLLPETMLAYDKVTRRLSLGQVGIGRAQARVQGDAQIIADIVRQTPGLGVNDLKKLARDTDIGTKVARAQAAIEAARAGRAVHAHDGPNRARFHHPGAFCEVGSCPERRNESEPVNPVNPVNPE